MKFKITKRRALVVVAVIFFFLFIFGIPAATAAADDTGGGDADLSQNIEDVLAGLTSLNCNSTSMKIQKAICLISATTQKRLSATS